MTYPSTQTRPETWELDPQHSQVAFAVRHMMISTVRGRFLRVSGTVVMDPAEPLTASAEIQIDASSIESGLGIRDDHLRSPDFLDTESYPVIVYRTTRVDRLGPDTYAVQGELSIRGIVRDVPLLVVGGGIVTDPWGTQRAGFSATTKISRTDFGLTWNAALETGGVAVGDDVTIGIDVELLRASRQSAA
jgi:polyisoprenoid-binding protein YceI